MECRAEYVLEEPTRFGAGPEGRRMPRPGNRESAIDEIVGQYRMRVYWTVRRIAGSHDEAEDITQEVFISVWQHLAAFRGDSELWPWIYRIAVNAALGRMRSVHRKRMVDIDELSHLLVSDVTTDAVLLQSDQEKLMRSVVDTLPPRQQTVFKLRYFSHMKYEEMAHVLDRSTGTLKANYHHAVHKVTGMLRKYLAVG